MTYNCENLMIASYCLQGQRAEGGGQGKKQGAEGRGQEKKQGAEGRGQEKKQGAEGRGQGAVGRE